MSVIVELYGENDTDARIWYTSSKDNQKYGLAMSRALGDREATAVIAVPTINKFSKRKVIQDIVNKVNTGIIEIINPMKRKNKNKQQQQQECDINDPMNPGVCTSSGTSSTTTRSGGSDVQISERNVELFVVSATDGIIDYILPQQIADSIGPSLYSSGHGQYYHPISAVESILHDATTGWNKSLQGQYRDDMVIAITTVL